MSWYVVMQTSEKQPNATSALTALTTPRDTVDLMVPLHKRGPSSCLIKPMQMQSTWFGECDIYLVTFDI